MDRRAANAERLAEIRRCFIDRSVPLTPAEEAEHLSRVADQAARDDARRAGQTQQAALPLNEAA
jgi:hypothetical protein